MQEYYLSIISGQRQGILAAILRAILKVFSWVYAGIVYLMRLAYEHGIVKSYDLGRPVISVGNITWGGVGKTPLTEWLIKQCLQDGKNPVVLMRGYMQDRDAQSDEAQLLEKAFDGKVPVIAQKDRVQGALKVPSDYAYDVFILDDGFQHWRVKRDLDIVAIDAIDPFGNGSVIPRGSLREMLKVLSNADLIILTKCDLGSENLAQIKQTLERYCPQVPVVQSIHGPRDFSNLRNGESVDLSAMKNGSALLVSGIGSPDGFEQSVQALGVDVKEHVRFSDHHIYTLSDVEKISSLLKQHQLSDVIMTSKDAVKFKNFMGQLPKDVRVLVLNIEISIEEGEEVLRDTIRQITIH